MNNFRKAGIVCLTVGAVLIVSALLLLVHNRMEDRRAGEAAEQVMPEIMEIITAKQTPAAETEETEKTEEPAEEVREEEELPAEPEEPSEEEAEESPKMTVEQIAGYGYIGILSIPSLGLDLPVMDECTDGNLKKAPCRYHGSTAEDNLVIAGHNYRQHFGYLSNVNYGDEVTFTDMDGTVHRYEVGLVEVLAATAVDEMNNSDWELSLYTCTYSGTERITVRCERTEE